MEYKGLQLPDIDLTDALNQARQEFKYMLDEEISVDYLNRLQLHINLVNYFGNKLGKSFLNHDKSKITMLLPAYRIFRKDKEERTKEENDALDMATLIHITGASHHPEYWTDTNMSGFTRESFCPNGVIDTTEMPEEAIDEMLCDWCSMSVEFENSPFDWFNKVNGTRWLFTQEQQQYILNTLHKLWDDEEFNF